MNIKGLRILRMLQNKKMTRAEIALELHVDIAAINDLIELLHTHFQYIKLSIVNDGDIICAQPPIPKYSITPAGRAYLLSIRQMKTNQITLAVAGSVSLLCLIGILRSFHKRCFFVIKDAYEHTQTTSIESTIPISKWMKH